MVGLEMRLLNVHIQLFSHKLTSIFNLQRDAQLPLGLVKTLGIRIHRLIECFIPGSVQGQVE